MFGFLTPAALFGLGLIGIPVLVHLFRPRKVRQTPFSSLRWLRPTRHRFSRRVHWHQLLLLAMRIAFLLLMLLALAKPIYSRSDHPEPMDRIIVADLSRSMGYLPPDGPRPIRLAARVIEQLLADPVPERRSTLILAGSTPRSIGPLVRDPLPYIPSLDSLATESADADLAACLPLVRSLLDERSEATAAEIYFVTDHHAGNWSAGAVRNFARGITCPVSINVIDVGSGEGQNAWIADAKLIASSQGKSRVVQVRIQAVGHQTRERLVRFTGVVGMADAETSVSFNDDGHADLQFEIPPAIPLRGQVAKIQIKPADGLPDDDTFWMNLDASTATRALLVAARPGHPGPYSSAFHLATALDVLAASIPGTLQLTRQDPGEALGPEIATADIVVMADVPSLTDTDLRALHQHVFDGGSLVLFLGPTIDPDFYNAGMPDPAHPTRRLLSLQLGDLVHTSNRSSPAGLQNIARTHPLFNNLLDPIYGDLAGTSFQTYYPLAPAVAGHKPHVLATIGESTPAIAQWPLGAGSVILFNTTANDAWSDLARRNAFVPLVDRLVKHLVGPRPQKTYQLGKHITLPLPGKHHDVSISVTTPAGRTIYPHPTAGAGIRLKPQVIPGVFNAAIQRPTGVRRFPFVVQSDRKDSFMVRTDRQQFQSWWSPIPVHVFRPDRELAEPTLAAAGMPLEPWCVACACVVLLMEMFLVHRLCPMIQVEHN